MPRASRPPRLQVGLPAPRFETNDIDGKPVSLSTYGGRWLYLILGRFAGCPFCSLRLTDLARDCPRLAGAGIDVLVIFPSRPRRVARYREKYQPPFRIVSDPEQKIFEAFGSETSWEGELRTAANVPKLFKALSKARLSPFIIDDLVHRMPSEYLIAPDGKIARVHYGASLDDGMPAAKVLATVREGAVA